MYVYVSIVIISCKQFTVRLQTLVKRNIEWFLKSHDPVNKIVSTRTNDEGGDGDTERS